MTANRYPRMEPVSKLIVSDGKDTEAWSGSHSFDSVLKQSGNLQSLKISSSSGATNFTTLTFDSVKDYSAGNYIELWIHVDNAINLAAIQLIFDKGTLSSNYALKSLDSTDVSHGWTYVRLHHKDFTNTGNFVDGDWASIASLTLRVQSNAGVIVNVNFNNVISAKWVGEVAFEIDDGLIEVHPRITAFMDERKIRCSWYIATTKVNSDPLYASIQTVKDCMSSYQRRNISTLQKMLSNGHVVGFHIDDLIDNGNYISKTYDEQRADMVAGTKQLEEWGIHKDGNRFHFASSQGYVDGNTKVLQRDFFATARANSYPATFGGVNVGLTHDQGGYNYRNDSLGAGFTDAEAKEWIDEAVNDQRHVVFVFHYGSIAVNPNDLAVTDASLVEFLDHAVTYRNAGTLNIINRIDMLGVYHPTQVREDAMIRGETATATTVVGLPPRSRIFTVPVGFEAKDLDSVDKDSSDKVDYAVDFALKLRGDTITLSTVTATNNLVVSDVQTTGSYVVFWISGGDNGSTSRVDVKITSSTGRVFERSFKVEIKQL